MLADALLDSYNGGMADSGRGHSNLGSDDDPDEGSSTFAWEFGNDEPSIGTSSASSRDVRATPPVVRGSGRLRNQEHFSDRAFREARSGQESAARHGPQPRRAASAGVPAGGHFGPARGNTIRDQLDRALDRWWALGEIPSVALLRDGLLWLQAGGSATESQRTLLLRSALAYGRGIQTALRHQVDVERVALVLSEALVEWQPPFLPEELDVLLGPREDVRAALVAELQQSRVLLTGEPRRRAQMALAVFAGAESGGLGRESYRFSAFESAPPPARRWLRKLLLVLLLIALLGFVFWQQRQSLPNGMVTVPDGSYFLPKAGEALADVESMHIGAFAIDRFEVTNRAYRTCVERGICSWPVRPGSATRAAYFTDPAFNDFPVVNVTQPMAARYCAWQDKRLPTAAEWQIAASLAPATNQLFRFPWGESFDPQRTNSSATEFGDTIVVGSFRPAGDSPTGAADMAGNVAEWTATVVSVGQSFGVETPQTEGNKETTLEAVVKGGSFASEIESLTAGAEMYVEIETATPELGFRCAVSR